MIYLVSYDVRATRRRNRVAKHLETHGRRIQLSVCLLDDPTIRPRALLAELGDLIDPKTDRIDLFPLCRRCLGSTEGVGRPLPPTSDGAV